MDRAQIRKRGRSAPGVALASSQGGATDLHPPRVDYKPGLVPIAGCPSSGEDHSSRRRVATALEHSNPGTANDLAVARSGGPPATVPQLKLAPGRACLAAGHPAVARGLLPHDFTLTGRSLQDLRRSPACPPRHPEDARWRIGPEGRSNRPAVSFLLRFPSGHPGSVLPTSLPCGARTFLPRTVLVRRRSSVHLRLREPTWRRADRQRRRPGCREGGLGDSAGGVTSIWRRRPRCTWKVIPIEIKIGIC
jgi:hypothetical protein